MKNFFGKIMLLAMAAMTFVACEDVPEPYDKPGTGSNVPGKNETTVIEGGTGTGVVSDPINAIAALNIGNGLSAGEETADYMYIKGKVVSVKEEFTTQYGNATFYISEDGTATNQFYVYRVLYLGNKKYASGDAQIKAGDDVVVCAKITNYNGTVETAQNKGFLYILNGENRGGEIAPSTPAAEPVGDGTKDSPYNVSGVLKYISSLGADQNSPIQVYVKGKISQVKEEFSTTYGNGTFYISDDGSASNEFYVFRTLYLGNKKFANGDTQIKAGDEVIICGNVVNFKGNTPETVQNSSYLYSLNGVTGQESVAGEPKGSGTQADPYNAAAALKLAQETGDAESAEVYIKGKVASIREQYGTQYGNATFDISDDGTTATTTFTVFRALYLGNQKYTGGATLNVGDEVVVCGKVTNYRGDTPETVQGKAYLYSLNGATEAGGGQEPAAGEPKGSGTQADPFNVQAIINYVSSLPADVDTQQDYYVKGIVTSIPNNGISTQYNNLSFYISDAKSASNSFYVFRAKGLNGGDVTENMIKVGDEVVFFGSTWVNYRGNTPETKAGEAYIVSITEGEGGGEQPGGGGEINGNTTSIDFTAQGFENSQEITTVTLLDGTTITFSAGENRNAPKYYSSGTSIRMYPSNFFIINSSKKIASVKINCSANNAEGQVSASSGTVSVEDMTLTVNGVNSTSVQITNAHTGTGTTSQLRISSMAITYAE